MRLAAVKLECGFCKSLALNCLSFSLLQGCKGIPCLVLVWRTDTLGKIEDVDQLDLFCRSGKCEPRLFICIVYLQQKLGVQ